MTTKAAAYHFEKLCRELKMDFVQNPDFKRVNDNVVFKNIIVDDRGELFSTLSKLKTYIY